MTKLINAYRKLPSPTNRAKLAAYLVKHPMAVALASQDDLHFLRVNEFLN
jgi:hypothetical protein